MCSNRCAYKVLYKATKASAGQTGRKDLQVRLKAGWNSWVIMTKIFTNCSLSHLQNDTHCESHLTLIIFIQNETLTQTWNFNYWPKYQPSQLVM